MVHCMTEESVHKSLRRRFVARFVATGPEPLKNMPNENSTHHDSRVCGCKDPVTASESGSESEKVQRISDKHQRKFSF